MPQVVCAVQFPVPPTDIVVLPVMEAERPIKKLLLAVKVSPLGIENVKVIVPVPEAVGEAVMFAVKPVPEEAANKLDGESCQVMFVAAVSTSIVAVPVEQIIWGQVISGASRNCLTLT